MKNIIVLMALLVPLAACSQTEQGATIGGLSGAAIGTAVASPHNRAEGALVGGALGAVAGALIGSASEPNRCRYRDGYGRVYTAQCPRGYDDRYNSGRYDNRYRYDDRYSRNRYDDRYYGRRYNNGY